MMRIIVICAVYHDEYNGDTLSLSLHPPPKIIITYTVITDRQHKHVHLRISPSNRTQMTSQKGII